MFLGCMQLWLLSVRLTVGGGGRKIKRHRNSGVFQPQCISAASAPPCFICLVGGMSRVQIWYRIPAS